MIVGIPLYAKTFMLSNGGGDTNYTLHMPSELNVGGDAGPSTAAAGTLSYYEVSAKNREWRKENFVCGANIAMPRRDYLRL